MRNWIFSLVFFILLIGYRWIQHPPRTQIDGIRGELLWIVATPDTKYGEGYSHEAFLKVHQGMTAQEVCNILGPPLSSSGPLKYNQSEISQGRTTLYYIESPSDSHYRLRQVVIHNSRVKERIGYYYLD